MDTLHYLNFSVRYPWFPQSSGLPDPRDPLAVAAFSLAVHSGASLLEAVKIAKRNFLTTWWKLPWITSFRKYIIKWCVNVSGHWSRNISQWCNYARWWMNDDCYVSRAMIEFSEATFSDLVRAYHFNQTFSSSWKFSVCRDCFLIFRFLSHQRHCNKFTRYLNALEEAR